MTEPLRSDPPATRPPRENLVRAISPEAGCSLRSADNGGMPTLYGYFARFNEWTEIDSRYEGHFLERVAPGAFAKTFREQRDSMRCLFEHGRDPHIGNKILGPILSLAEEDEGAQYEVSLLDTSYNRDLLPGLEQGLYGASFRFSVLRDEYVQRPKKSAHNPRGLPERTLLELKVPEFGPVTFPAYEGATAGVRSLTDEFLRDQLAEPEVTSSRLSVAITELPVAGGAGLVEHVKVAVGDEESRTRARLFERSARYVSEGVWAMHDSAMQTIKSILAERAAGHEPTIEEIRARIGTRDTTPVDEESPVAVIGIYGPIIPHATLFSNVSGAAAIDDIRDKFRTALADENVQAIVFDVDSPGGSIDLIPELAAEILAARGDKPIVAVANTWAASGAYWLASACDEIYVTPSGEVGSIGVITAHDDLTAANALEGIKTTLVTYGQYKGELSPFRPLSDEAKQALQEKVDAYGEMFIKAVADGRGVDAATVKADFGEGRMLLAKTALAAGMVDGIDTLESVIARLAAGDDGQRSTIFTGPTGPDDPIDEPGGNDAELADNGRSQPEPPGATTRGRTGPEPSGATTRAISSDDFVEQLERSLQEEEEERWTARS